MAKTEFEQELSSASANAVYLLKTEDDTITGVLSLENDVDVNKHISDLQEHLYTMADIIGIVGENDPNAKIYANTNYIANGDSRKVCIEKLDAQAKVNADNIASNLVLINNNATSISDILASIGAANGICPLDANTKIDAVYLPDTLLLYQGTWDASTNTPTLDDTDTGKDNYWYRCNVAGSVDFGAGSISFSVGDKVVNNGTIWEKWDTTDEVISWNGRTGAVVPQSGDYTASDVGLGNVTNDAQLKRAAGDLNTFTEKAVPVEDDIVIIEDSEDTFNKKKVKLSNMLGSGGGGGGSFIWEMNGNISPLENINNGISTYDFSDVEDNEIWAFIAVPESYTAGDQITLEDLAFIISVASGNVFFRLDTTLTREGEILSWKNRLSTNTELTVAASDEVIRIGSLDITDASGEVDGTAVAPGDYISLKLYRDVSEETASTAADAQLIKYSASIKLDN